MSAKKKNNLADNLEEDLEINPLIKSNFISRIFFAWIIPLFEKGFKQDLNSEDFFNITQEDSSKFLGNKLEKIWKQLGKNPRIFHGLFKIYGKYYIFLIAVYCFNECVLRVLTTMLLRLFIQSFSKDQSDEISDNKFYYAAGICIFSLLFTILDHLLLFEVYRIGLKCRVGLSSLLYRKVLRLSKSSQGQTSVGQLTNLLGNDIGRFDTNIRNLAYLFLSPIQFLIFIYILWKEIGAASIGGFVFIGSLLPFQYFIMKYSAVFRMKISIKTDDRVKLINEIVMGVRMIKMYAWEKPFSDLIYKKRDLEIKELRKRTYLRAGYNSLFYSAEKLVVFICVLQFVILGNELSPDKIFFAASIYNIVMNNMVYLLPLGISNLSELFISIQRVEKFFELEEQSSNITNLKKIEGKNDNFNNGGHSRSIILSSVTASWTDNKITLKNLNAELSGSKLIIIIGPVGCGKSSFLNVLLSELHIGEGKCFIDGSISYASQDPWIFSGTIRDNIVCGRNFNEVHYKKIVEICALESDFIQMTHGDLSLVGQNGSALSGGQKSRVNLARAMYQIGDIYLLDDPLSGVDPGVSSHIFENCLKKYLNDKLRILVTHQCQYLSSADFIIVMNEGGILDQGTYSELVDRKIDLGNTVGDGEIYEKSNDDIKRVENPEKIGEKPDIVKKENEEEETKEEIDRGSVTLATYKNYFQAGNSNFISLLIILFFILSQTSKTISDYWLAIWTNRDEYEHSIKMGNGSYEKNLNYYQYLTEGFSSNDMNLIVYSIIMGGIVLFVLLSSFIFNIYCLVISVNLHKAMFSHLIRAPISFFDANPGGRIMNRFTRDMSSVDENLPTVFFDTVSILLHMVGSIIIVLFVNWYTIFPTLALGGLSWLIRIIYMRTVRDVKRIDSISKSPIFNHMANTFSGIGIIRSSGSQSTFISKFEKLQDESSAAWFMYISTSRAFALWLDLICVLYLTSIVLSFLFFSASTLSGDVGIALLSALGMNGILQFGMRQSAETENIMTSVERIMEYSKIEPEAPLHLPTDKQLDKNWPSDGAIEFNNVSLSYLNKSPILKNISFSLGKNEKIGIVGRTGAGKSSLISTIFRLSEPDGKILIDGVDISKIGLFPLRKNITIIPQESTLFSGTIRYNLDPFQEKSDIELWCAIEKVELRSEISSLEFMVEEGGKNFSSGQRQLICLARAILKNSKIIVMDEATANVDPRTDNLIQETIKNKFANCSILTIAHRLHTVMDYDKILVLSNGVIMEFDHPHILLQDEKSFLSKMVEEAGNNLSQNLRDIAHKSFISSNK